MVPSYSERQFGSMFYGKYKILTRSQQHMNDTRLTLGINPVCSSPVETLQATQTTMIESRDRYLITKALSSQDNKRQNYLVQP